MKRAFFCLFLIMATIQASEEHTSAFAEAGEEPSRHSEVSYGISREVILEANVAYFRPTSSTFRQIYGSALINYLLDLNVQLLGGLYSFLDANFIYKKGRSIGNRDRTRIFLVPIDVGFKYFFILTDFWKLYAKLGAEITAAFIKDDTTVGAHNLKDSAAGGIGGIGTLFNFSGFVLDIFADYSFVNFHPINDKVFVDKSTRQIGGLLVGGGIGYQF